MYDYIIRLDALGNACCVDSYCSMFVSDLEANKTMPPEALPTRSSGQTTTTVYRSTTSAGGSRATTSAGESVFRRTLKLKLNPGTNLDVFIQVYPAGLLST